MRGRFSVAVLSPEVYAYGSMVVAGSLEKAGFRVCLAKFDESTSLKDIPRADVYAIGLYSTLHVLRFREWMRRLKEATGSPMIVGGPVTQIPELVLSNMDFVDAVVVGEGEESTVDLVEALMRSSDLDSVDGIAFRDGELVVKTRPREPIDMEHRPMPKIPSDIAEQSVRGAHVYIEVLRGCKGSCTFCQVPRLFGKKIRSRPIDEVVEEVKMFRKKGAHRIAISGGTTSFYKCDGGWVNEDELCKLLKSISEVVGPRNLSAPDIRVDAASDGVLQAIAKYTIGWVFFGIESGSQRMLDKMLKGFKTSDVEDAVYRAKRVGVKPAGSFIVAYPGESEEDFEETINLVRELPLMDHFVSIAEPIPGTPLAEEIANMGLDENPLFKEDESSLGKLYNLSIAESRAYRLMVEGYYSRSLVPIGDDQVLKLFLKEAKKQGEDIRLCTKLVKELYSKLNTSK